MSAPICNLNCNDNGNVNAKGDRNHAGNFGGSRLNSNANSFSPNQAYQRGQFLRNLSVQDSANSHAQYGAIGSYIPRSNDSASFSNSNYLTNGVPYQEAVEYGHPSSSSLYPDHGRRRSFAMPNNAVFSNNLASPYSLSGGPTTVSIGAEYEPLDADPARPSFLHGATISSIGEREWFAMVLPHVSTFPFEIETTTVLYYATLIFSSSQLVELYKAVTKMAAALPGLKEITLTMHTAGTTMSAFGERQMIALESTDPERARERVNMSLDQVVRRYDLHGLFGCRGLRRVRIEYIDCQRTASFTRVAHPVNLIRQIHIFLVNGFMLNGMDVVVELVRVA